MIDCRIVVLLRSSISLQCARHQIQSSWPEPMVVTMLAFCVRHFRSGQVWAGAEPAELNQQESCNDQWAKKGGARYQSSSILIAPSHKNIALLVSNAIRDSIDQDPAALLAPQRLDFQRPEGQTEERGKTWTKGAR